eukprot:5111095-Amphidinium_carterae.1
MERQASQTTPAGTLSPRGHICPCPCQQWLRSFIMAVNSLGSRSSSMMACRTRGFQDELMMMMMMMMMGRG